MKCAKPSYAFALAMHIKDINKTKQNKIHTSKCFLCSFSITNTRCLVHVQHDKMAWSTILNILNNLQLHYNNLEAQSK